MKLGPKTMVVVLDDVAGSGETLDGASSAVSSTGYKGRIVIAPLVSTSTANKVFIEPGKGSTSTRANTSYAPGRVMPAVRDSPMYSGLPEVPDVTGRAP